MIAHIILDAAGLVTIEVVNAEGRTLWTSFQANVTDSIDYCNNAKIDWDFSEVATY